MDFSGQTVLITGASRGIGAAAAEHFATLGAQVVLTARSEAELAKLAEKIGSKALAIACDIADFAQVQAAVDQTVARFGRLDIVVNNAGMLLPVHRMADFEAADWDRVIDVNVKGVFYMMKAALPIMTAQGGGTILNISSGAAYGVLEGWSHYCASALALWRRRCRLRSKPPGLIRSANWSCLTTLRPPMWRRRLPISAGPAARTMRGKISICVNPPRALWLDCHPDRSLMR